MIKYIKELMMAFKTKTVTAEKMLKEGGFYPVQLDFGVVPKIEKNGFLVAGGHVFTCKQILIYKIIEMSSYIRIYYKDTHGNNNFFTCSKDLKFKILIGPTGVRMIKEYKESMINNVAEMLIGKGTVGSDPEIFVEDNKGIIIPAFEFLGSKSKPNITDSVYDHMNGSFADAGKKPVYWDGFQAEFETGPNSCLAFHVDSIYLGLRKVSELAKKHNPNARLSAKTVMEIPQDVMQNAKKEHVELGCMPSYNAYNMKGIKVDDARELIMRPAGGHIHFDIKGDRFSKEKVIQIVKALDALLAVPCVAMFQKYDNPIRRTMYGLAGEYRTPPHGLEYRTLSNAWLFHPLITNVVFDVARKIVSLVRYNGECLIKMSEKEAIECVNNCDVQLAHKLMERNKKLLEAIYVAAYGPPGKVLYNVFYKGMHEYVQNPEDIEGNWLLDKLEKHEGWVGHGEAQDKKFGNSYKKLLNGKKVA